MKLGLVIGTVVATRKDERLIGTKLMVIQPLSMSGTTFGEPLVAVDTVGAGVGERIIYVQGSVASWAIVAERAPADAAIVGIVDHVEVSNIKELTEQQ